jgi:hypothetical protein
MDLNHLREYGVLTLEPKIEGLPKEIHWWKPLELDEKRIKLVSDPGRYYLEIRSDQIERLISFADKINGVEGCALVLTGRISYEQLQFVFRPHPPIEPVRYVILAVSLSADIVVHSKSGVKQTSGRSRSWKSNLRPT